MDDRKIKKISNKIISEFFWKSPNPMAITKAENGTYIEVNEAFEKCMGMPYPELVGQTSVGIGYITAEQRSVIFNEIKENGYAQNIELDVKVKKNETRCGLFNSTLIKLGKDGLWLTVVTDISRRRMAAKARQDDILLKSLAAVEETGVILIRGHQKRQRYSFFINKEARRILGRKPLKDLLDAIDRQKSTYFSTQTGCYHVKTILSHGSGYPWKLILLDRLPYPLFIEEKLKQYNMTGRQGEVALLAAIGHSNVEIAEKLFISEHTVKDHMKDIYKIVGIHNRSELFPKLLNLR